MGKATVDGLRARIRQLTNDVAIKEDEVAKLEAEIEQIYAWLSDLEARRDEEANKAEVLKEVSLQLTQLASSLNLQVEQLVGALFASDLECAALRVALEAAIQEIADRNAELARRDEEDQVKAAREAEIERIATLMPNRNWVTHHGIIELRADGVPIILYPGGDWEEVGKYAGGKVKTRRLVGKGTVIVDLPLIGRLTIDDVEVVRLEEVRSRGFTDFEQRMTLRIPIGGLVYDYHFQSKGWIHDAGLRIANLSATRQEWCESCQGYHNPAIELQAWFAEA